MEREKIAERKISSAAADRTLNKRFQVWKWDVGCSLSSS